ncbi:MAG: anion permease [Chlamydia sp.]
MDSITILCLFSLVIGFYTTWNVGANDVSNAMGTSVGSKSLTLKQAVIIASVCEFLGAWLFGANVSQTLRTELLNTSIIKEGCGEYSLIFGMVSSLLATGMWLHYASYLGLPVSTTHSIVGAIIGFGLVSGGVEAIQWKTVGYVSASWIISPIFGCIGSYLIFTAIRKAIILKPFPLKSAQKILPWICGIFISIVSIVWLSSLEIKKRWITTLLIPIFALSYLFFYYIVHRSRFIKMQKEGCHTEEMEKLFGFLQIATAALMAFSHGANDVSNGIGPLQAILEIGVQKGNPLASAVLPYILFLGGIGIVIGITTWGWRVIETIGKNITELTPSRGFSAEFGASLTVLIASKIGLPVSTTHTLVGAVIGIGLAGDKININTKTMRDIIISWAVTIPGGAILSIIWYRFFTCIYPIICNSSQ